jgi:hypothetical protein
MYCRKCGKELDGNIIYCGSCGASIDGRNVNVTPDRTAYYMPYAEKSVGIALILGFFYAGLGHLYIEKLVRGLCIMMVNLVLVAALMTVLLLALSDDYLTSDEAIGFLFFVALLGIPAFIIWLWNLFDVNNLTKKYNDSIRRTGDSPW